MRKLPEDEMIRIGGEFIIGNYGLNEEQIVRMELYTSSFEEEENCRYETVDGKPCFQVEYLLFNDEYETGDLTRRPKRRGFSLSRGKLAGFYNRQGVIICITAREKEEPPWISAV